MIVLDCPVEEASIIVQSNDIFVISTVHAYGPFQDPARKSQSENVVLFCDFPRGVALQFQRTGQQKRPSRWIGTASR